MMLVGVTVLRKVSLFGVGNPVPFPWQAGPSEVPVQPGACANASRILRPENLVLKPQTSNTTSVDIESEERKR
jgi:hypothetical protein